MVRKNVRDLTYLYNFFREHDAIVGSGFVPGYIEEFSVRREIQACFGAMIQTFKVGDLEWRVTSTRLPMEQNKKTGEVRIKI